MKIRLIILPANFRNIFHTQRNKNLIPVWRIYKQNCFIFEEIYSKAGKRGYNYKEDLFIIINRSIEKRNGGYKIK